MEFWRGRRVFVTGHTGFKGSWLCLWLHDLGARVTGFALPPPTRPSLFEVARVGGLVNSLIGDVRDLAALTDALRSSRPEIVIHMAAQSLVREFYDQPVETYATNVMGTVHLFEAVRIVGGVRSLICVTSDKCYENRESEQPYREDDPMGGFDPYSSSKGCAELVTAAYRRSFFPVEDIGRHGVALASARAGNVVGGGDWARDRLIPDLLTGFSTGRRPVIRFPNSIRPWQHVMEPLAGYLMLAEKLWRGEARFAAGWNFGPDEHDARPVNWIADRLAQAWGGGAGWDKSDLPQPHEAGYLKLDSTRARAELGWSPTWPLEICLERIVEWQHAFLAGRDARDTTLAQIRAHRVAAGTPRQ